MNDIIWVMFFRTWVDKNLVEATCGESIECQYDYSVTLSREFAIFTKYYQDQFINIREGVLKPEARGECKQLNSISLFVKVISSLNLNFQSFLAER